MPTKLDFIARVCPLCGGDAARVLVEATLDETRLTASAFASRKLPEYMHSRMVECGTCGMLYANPVLRPESLADAYKDASFDSGAESRLAALTYRSLLEPQLQALPSRTSALDIGAGDGAFVEELLALGFTNIVGVEPSTAPIAAAKPAIRGYLRSGVFAAEQFPKESLDLITCFQVIEHVWDPVKIAADAFALLRPGGMFFIVAHDRRALSARVMGTKSPIFDIEHLQLFDKRTVATLLRNAGFSSITVSSVQNKYPVDYWLKLFPLPAGVKTGCAKRCRKLRHRAPLALFASRQPRRSGPKESVSELTAKESAPGLHAVVEQQVPPVTLRSSQDDKVVAESRFSPERLQQPVIPT